MSGGGLSMRRCVVCALLIAGCGGPAASAADGGADLSANPGEGIADLSVPDLAVADLATPNLAMPDLFIADLAQPDQSPPPPDLSPPVDMAYSCTTSSTVASAAAAGSGPSLAYVAPYWGVTWTNGSGASIMYNSVNLGAGTPLQNAGDVTIVAAQSGFTYAGPRVVSAGTQFAVGYGYSVTFGSPPMSASGPGAALVPAQTGSPVTNRATGVLQDSTPAQTGGIAYRPTGPLYGLLVRSTAAIPGKLAFAYFDATLSAGGGAAGTSSTTANATAIGYAATSDKWGMAYLGSSPHEGDIEISNPLLNGFTIQTFTAGADSPTTTANSGVSVVGNGDRFAIAWTDAQSCTGCTSGSEIYLTVLPIGGSRIGEVHVTPASARPKYMPRVAWDGRSYVVAWLEYSGANTDGVYLQRFDATTLAPLAPAVQASSTLPAFADIGLAVAGIDDYGVAFQATNTSKQTLVHITCNGP